MTIKPVIDKVFAAKVSAVKRFGDDVKEISFKLDRPFSFIPGQYVWVEIPKLKTPDIKGSRRAFSICSIPNKKNTISIVYRISQSGYKQELSKLAEGDSVVIHGPFGSLHFPENPQTPVICVAGGVGIAPFVSLIPDSLANVPARNITLLYANAANKEEIGRAH